MRCRSFLLATTSRQALRALCLAAALGLALLGAEPSRALPALFDFGSGPALSGWTAIELPSPSGVSEGVTLTLSATNPAGGLDDRDRGGSGNGGGAESDMWRDFIFAVPDVPNDVGLQIDLAGLTPGSSYDVTIWSFDSAGSQADSRISSWNGELYSFQPSGDLPEDLDDNNVVVRVLADAGGMAQIIGESLEPADPGAFINGLRVELPEPGLAALLGMALAAGVLRRR